MGMACRGLRQAMRHLFRLLVGALIFAALGGTDLIDDGDDGAAQQAQQDTGEHGEDHVGGVVDV